MLGFQHEFAKTPADPLGLTRQDLHALRDRLDHRRRLVPAAGTNLREQLLGDGLAVWQPLARSRAVADVAVR
jgi:hypothetical protein